MHYLLLLDKNQAWLNREAIMSVLRPCSLFAVWRSLRFLSLLAVAVIVGVIAVTHSSASHQGFATGFPFAWGLNTSGRAMQELAPIDWVEAFRTLPLDTAADAASQDLSFWHDWLAHPTKDAYWDAVDYERRHSQMTVPALIMGGWYDLYADDVFRQFTAMRAAPSAAARRSQLVVGPWPHLLSDTTRTGSLDFGARSLLDLDAAEVRWYDRWLKEIPNGAEDDPPIRLFVMGANRWREEREWPLARTEWQPWYFHSAEIGRAHV